MYIIIDLLLFKLIGPKETLLSLELQHWGLVVGEGDDHVGVDDHIEPLVHGVTIAPVP